MNVHLAQRREPIRSKALREAARGEECTLKIFGVCVGGTETTVLAHLHDETFGRSQKADDTSAVFACFGCHNEIDGRTRRTEGEDLTWYKLRALQRTVRRLVERGIMSVKLDVAKPFTERPTKPRKPRGEGRAVPKGPPLESRSEWPKGRKIPARAKERSPA
jgi:hypothetical protein